MSFAVQLWEHLLNWCFSENNLHGFDVRSQRLIELVVFITGFFLFWVALVFDNNVVIIVAALLWIIVFLTIFILVDVLGQHNHSGTFAALIWAFRVNNLEKFLLNGLTREHIEWVFVVVH